MTVVRDRYELIEVVGRGGQGLVFRARDTQHDRTVALKMRLASEDRDALLSEARILLGLRPHASLPLVREDFFEGDRYYVAMDWIAGRSLRDELWERGDPGLPPAEVLERLTPVAEALDHLHDHEPPIVHGDVKPANIVVRADGTVVLVDFGIAGSDGSRRGTPGFAAPEVLAGARPTPAADVFGLAATAYALLTGAPPRAGTRPRWRGVSRAESKRLEAALGRGLALDPDRRPARASELLAALRGDGGAPTNLPRPATSFVGRAAAIRAVRELLGSGRLVTLTGTGGVGKTRLALRVATDLLPTIGDGVWLAELAAIADPALVPSAIATAVGVREEPGAPPLDAACDHLRARDALLVLDNCEHLIDACAVAAETILERCPGVRIIATSREPLAVAGETTWRVPSLEAPDPDDPGTIESSESAGLFIDRARAADPSFTPSDPAVVAQICLRLDGIPLAIELAAARVRTMSLEDIATGLDDRFALLTGGRRTALPRQRTLRALVDWSWDLLDDDERAVLSRMSVFAGGFTLEAAREVADAPPDTVARLADRSLVVPRDGRYEMLETIRSYAAERLAERDETAEVRARHRSWVRGLAAEADRAARGPDQQRWLDRLEQEHDNIRAALASAEDHPVDATAIASGVWGLWESRGHLSEGRRWLAHALASGDAVPAASRARAAQRAGILAQRQGDYAAAASLYEESLLAAREAGDERTIADALHNLAMTAYLSGDTPGARERSEEALAIRRGLGEARDIADSLTNLSVFSMAQGDYGAAREYVDESLPMYRRLGDRSRESDALMNLGAIAEEVGDTPAAVAAYEQALSIRRDLGDPWRVAHSLGNLGSALRAHGDAAGATALFEEALKIQRRLDDRDGIAHSLLGLATASEDPGGALSFARESLSIRIALDDARGMTECLEVIAALTAVDSPARALESIGAARTAREGIGAPVPPGDRARLTEAERTARDALGDPAADQALQEGAATPVRDAARRALG